MKIGNRSLEGYSLPISVALSLFKRFLDLYEKIPSSEGKRVLAQSTDHSLSSPDDVGSNPAVGNLNWTNAKSVQCLVLFSYGSIL